jgi:hypothetical protein
MEEPFRRNVQDRSGGRGRHRSLGAERHHVGIARRASRRRPHGDCVYKSTDSGRRGRTSLDATRHIARIRVDPNNPDIV